jgi:hypothetical protein
MSEFQKSPILANKTFLTVGTVAGIIIVIIGPIMWAARKEADIQSSSVLIAELRNRMTNLETKAADTDVWRGKLDVTLTNMAKEISEIKKAVER